MWVLQGAASTSGKVHYLVCEQELVIGRREGHILLTKDNSISRRHASIKLTFPHVNVKTREPAKVEMRDLKSTYGIFVNDNIEKGERLPSGSTQELHHGDRIRFGMFDNIWRLEHQDLTVTTSTLRSAGLQQLTNALVILGGHLQENWSSDSCYLVMPTITLTVKVACALAAGRSIVLPEFFTKLVDAIINKAPHPNPAEFLPSVEDTSVSSAGGSFVPDPNRSTIFAGLTFLFPTEALMIKMCSPVQLAGGKVELLTEDNHEKVVSGKFILIRMKTLMPNTLYSKTLDLLKKHGLRAVPESDIGLAIVFVSTKSHCNSAYLGPTSFFRRSSSTQSLEKPKIFATETQSTEFSVSLTGPKVVPDSGEQQPSTSAQSEMAPPKVPIKRPLTTSDSDGVNVKRRNRASSPDLTEPLSSMDLCDKNTEVDDIKMEVTEKTFNPEHTSTQRDYPAPSTSLDPSTSVSFAPYTLPSLKTLENEEEEETEPFQGNRHQEDLLHGEERVAVMRKEEPRVKPNYRNDLKFDEWWKGDKEDDDAGRKRTRCEETSPQAQENKKSKTDSFSNKNSLSTHTDCDDSNRVNSINKRKAADNDGDIFALPRRARQRERTVENLTPKETADTELFDLPARTQRARRLLSNQDSSLIPPTLPSPIQETPDIAPTPTPESKTIVTTVKEGLSSSKFIDREETDIVKDTDNTGELTMSRTLVIVKPMVKVQPIVLQTPSVKSEDSSNLPNFKIFKKVTAASILKVIGGSDFVENDQIAASQEYKIDLEHRKNNEANIDKVPSFDEELFNLDGLKRKRR
ncbi:nibrin-like isoform X2 [Portunus trituberculatus]|uniref:nibrin-like isoform X2 n=1 Tax=Portunus trituberculatus TaxID=210409 RepID=UPI001E1D029C|nr:nibrin-like isoform X2 [Portunus trituberculatus]